MDFSEPVRDLHDSPVTLFELFMTDKLIDHICKETNAYAAQKGKHTFKIEPNELKSFLAVLLLSGYIPYSRRSMYWEMSSDSCNTIDSWMFCSIFIWLITITSTQVINFPK